MLRRFDLIVIGTGSAASTVAYECRKAGLEVAFLYADPAKALRPRLGSRFKE
jgi:pyruvate/2-oxoglutarate dehydrogenase complex dihydrolipoamide dehydrogenase (E3) component